MVTKLQWMVVARLWRHPALNSRVALALGTHPNGQLGTIVTIAVVVHSTLGYVPTSFLALVISIWQARRAEKGCFR